jgi:hypothetical protein
VLSIGAMRRCRDGNAARELCATVLLRWNSNAATQTTDSLGTCDWNRHSLACTCGGPRVPRSESRGACGGLMAMAWHKCPLLAATDIREFSCQMVPWRTSSTHRVLHLLHVMKKKKLS